MPHVAGQDYEALRDWYAVTMEDLLETGQVRDLDDLADAARAAADPGARGLADRHDLIGQAFAAGVPLTPSTSAATLPGGGYSLSRAGRPTRFAASVRLDTIGRWRDERGRFI